MSKRLSCPKHLFLQHRFISTFGLLSQVLKPIPSLPHLTLHYLSGWVRRLPTGWIHTLKPLWQHYCPSILGGHIHWNNPWCPRELSSVWPGLTWPPISTPQPLASLSLSPASESCNWVKWGRRKKVKTDESVEKHSACTPGAPWPEYLISVEGKTQCCLEYQKMMVRNWGSDISSYSHKEYNILHMQTNWSRDRQNHCERRLEN